MLQHLLRIAGVALTLAFAMLWQSLALHAANDEPRRILVLHPFNYSLPSSTALAEAIRSRLAERSRQRIEIDAEHLSLARVKEAAQERWIASFLRERYAQSPPDAIIALGESLAFLIRNGETFAPSVPVVFTAVTPEQFAVLKPPANMTGSLFDTVAHLNNTLTLAEALQPGARRLFVVAGSAALDRRWQANARRVIAGRERKFDTTFLFDLPYDRIREQIARVPTDAIVVVLTVLEDGAGKAFTPLDVAEDLSRLSPAPTYYPYYQGVGKGVVGASSQAFESLGADAADVVLEILAGKSPAEMPVQTNPDPTFRVDYRAMQRWGLSERDLPAGTAVLFKEPTIWDRHRSFVIGAGAAIAVLTAFTVALLLERRSRLRAEVEAALQRREIAHLTRVSVLGGLSGAIAHEINQPLTAILINAETAIDLLSESSPDVDEVRDALEEIVQENGRAEQVIRRLKNLLRKGEATRERVELNEIVSETIALLNSEFVGRGVRVQTVLANDLPVTAGDPVQLQQVLINFIMNGMDAMASTPSGQRLITIITRRRSGGGAEVVVRDRGTGIAPAEQDRIFDPFYTTKQRGLGLGLTISSTIMEAHRGEISIASHADGGAEARFSLPAESSLAAAQ